MLDTTGMKHIRRMIMEVELMYQELNSGAAVEILVATEDQVYEYLEEYSVDHIIGQYDGVDSYEDCDWILIDWGEEVEAFALNGKIDPDVFEYLEASEVSTAPSWDVFVAAYCGGIPADRVRDAYVGEYRDVEDFGYEMGYNSGEIPGWIESFIDWEKYGEFLMGNYIEEDNHYFTNYY
jgi:hypothetical protein